MQRLEVSGAVRPIYGSLGVKRLSDFFFLVTETRCVLLCGTDSVLKRTSVIQLTMSWECLVLYVSLRVTAALPAVCLIRITVVTSARKMADRAWNEVKIFISGNGAPQRGSVE